jgi:hypothetical protein
MKAAFQYTPIDRPSFGSQLDNDCGERRLRRESVGIRII